FTRSMAGVRSAVLAGAAALAGSTLALAWTGSAAAAVPGCHTSGLVIWLYQPPGGGTAGSTYYDLEFTNLSGHSCAVSGYPGVSAVNLTGGQVGKSASRNPAHPIKKVTLGNGASAIAVLQVTDVGNFPAASCHPTTAAGLKVYPPGQTAAKVAPFPFNACSAAAGPAFLHVEALQKS